MSWHEDISFEVELEFLRFMPHWERLEGALWFARHAKHIHWAACGKLFRQTALGRQKNRECTKKRHELLKAIPDGWIKCKACGDQFEVTVMQRRKGRSVCSLKCAGELRHRTDREPSARRPETSSQKQRRNQVRSGRYRQCQATPDGQSICLACGASFAVSLQQRRKGNTKVCGYACAGLLSSRVRETLRSAGRWPLAKARNVTSEGSQ
jgi:hypothetical protein